MGDMMTSVALIAVALLGIFWYNQQKFKDKLLCVFHTQNNVRIERWIPLRARHVKFGSKKNGDEGIYYVNPSCFSLTWWTRGLSRLFPVPVPTIEFWWYCPHALNPKAIQRWDDDTKEILPAISWHTPEVRNAAWQEQQARGFAKAAQAQATGRKMSSIERYLPLVTFGMVLFLALLLWQNGALGL